MRISYIRLGGPKINASPLNKRRGGVNLKLDLGAGLHRSDKAESESEESYDLVKIDTMMLLIWFTLFSLA